MFFTASAGGMFALTAPKAATGVGTGLYIRFNTVNEIDLQNGAKGGVNQSSFVTRWAKSSTPGSRTLPTK